MANASNINGNGKWVFKVDTGNNYPTSPIPTFPTTVTTTSSVPINSTVAIKNFLIFGPGVGDSILTKADDSTIGPFSISQTIPYLNLDY